MLIPKMCELFSLEHTLAKEDILTAAPPFAVLSRIKDICERLMEELDGEYFMMHKGIYVARDAKISNSATVLPPAIIGHDTELRPGAYIRGSVIIGDGCVIGNSTEIKNSIIFDGAQLPHYNYVGDSILGYKAHLGAGAVICNLRLDKKSVKIKENGEKLDTGLRKMGAFIGDGAEIGAGCVICPGSIIGKGSIIYPLSRVIGIIPDNYYYYGDERHIQKRKEGDEI